MDSKEYVQKLCYQKGWDFEKLDKYVNLIEEKNKVMNLTGFSGDRLWSEGILESLAFMDKIMKVFDKCNVLDIGAGVGFPSVPYFIANLNSNFQLDIYEPLTKRCDFLNLVIKELNITNIKVYKKRVEEQKQKNIYDIVTARAVADIQTLILVAFHLIRVGGKMILIKGKKVLKEVEDAEFAFKQVKYKLDIEKFSMTQINKDNHIVYITKLRSTPNSIPYVWKDVIKLRR
ncbi:16S rRNA (guanine(527)-N(7))-methyltransferase RsmG [Mycoplasma sp. 5912]